MKRLAAMLFAMTQAFGCGGDDEDDRLESVDGFCQEWAIRACNDRVVEDCSGSADNKDACVLAQRAFCEGLIPMGKYTPNGAEECLEGVGAAYEDARLTAEERETVRALGAPCNLVLSGTGGPGDGCDADGDCSTEAGLSCVIPVGADSGTCQEAEIVGGGLACGEPNQICEDEFYCNGSNCIVRAAEGAPCTTTEPCALELKCERPDGTPPDPEDTDATCVARIAAGATEACAEDDDCETGICDASRCVTSVILSPASSICGDLS